MEIEVEFEGFYESQAQDDLDNTQIMDLEELNMTLDEVLEKVKLTSDPLDYNILRDVWSRNYTEALVEEIEYQYGFELECEFKRLWSPRYYNFESDKIVVDISEEQIDNFIERFDIEEVNKYISEACKSRDGFASFYPTLKTVMANKEIHTRYIFKYLFYVMDTERIKANMDGVQEELSNSEGYAKWYEVYNMVVNDEEFKKSLIKQLNKLIIDEPREYTFGSAYALLDLYDVNWEDKKTNKDLLPVLGWLAIHDNEFSIG